MASTITLSASLSQSNTTNSATLSCNKSITQSSELNVQATQIIGTTTEAITMTDITSPGYVMFTNEDATNFVRIGLLTPVTAGDAFAHLLPGETCLIPTRQTTIYALADTAPVTISKKICSL